MQYQVASVVVTRLQIDPHVVMKIKASRKLGKIVREKFGFDEPIFFSDDKSADLPTIRLFWIDFKILAPERHGPIEDFDQFYNFWLLTKIGVEHNVFTLDPQDSVCGDSLLIDLHRFGHLRVELAHMD